MPAVNTYLDLAESDHPESPGLYWAAPCLTADDAAAFDPWARFPPALAATPEASGAGTGANGAGDGDGDGEGEGEGAAECRRRLIGVGAALWRRGCFRGGLRRWQRWRGSEGGAGAGARRVEVQSDTFLCCKGRVCCVDVCVISSSRHRGGACKTTVSCISGVGRAL